MVKLLIAIIALFKSIYSDTTFLDGAQLWRKPMNTLVSLLTTLFVIIACTVKYVSMIISNPGLPKVNLAGLLSAIHA